MRVSVVIHPIGDTAALQATLQGLALQTELDFEVLLAGDEPDPAARQALHPHANRLRWIGAVPNSWGQTRNRAVQHSHGDWVAFLEAGAIPAPQWLEELLALSAEAHAQDLVAVGGPIRGDAADSGIAVDRITGEIVDCPAAHVAQTLPYGDARLHLPAGNCAVRREAFRLAGGYHPIFQGETAHADWLRRTLDAGGRLRRCELAWVLRHQRIEMDARRTAWAADLIPATLAARRPHDREADLLAWCVQAIQQIIAYASESMVQHALHQSLSHGLNCRLAACENPPELPSVVEKTIGVRWVPTNEAATRINVAVIGHPTPADQPHDGWKLAESLRDAGHRVTLIVPSIAIQDRWSFRRGIWIQQVAVTAEMPPIRQSEALHAAVETLHWEQFLDAVMVPPDEWGYATAIDGGLVRFARTTNVSLAAPESELVTKFRAEAEAVLQPRPRDWGAELVAAVRASIDPAMRELPPPTMRRMRFSLICGGIAHRDATSNVTRSQFQAITDYCRAKRIRTRIRAFMPACAVPDSRVIITHPEACEVVTHPHVQASDLILIHFGFYAPGNQAIHFLPRSAKVVLCYHGITPPRFESPANRVMLHRSYEQLDYLLHVNQILVQSEYLAKELLAQGIARESIVRLPLPLAVPQTSELAELPETGTPLRLIYLGRVVPSKGLLDLFAAMSRVREQGGPELRLSIYSNSKMANPEHRAELESWVQAHHLEHAIEFCFDCENAEVAAAFRSADVLVMPSYHEGFCVPVIEALANGCRVLTTQAAALPETSGGLGQTIPPGDVEAMAACLSAMPADRDAGMVRTDSQLLSRADWWQRVQAYLPRFEPKRYTHDFLAAVFDGWNPPPLEVREYLAREQGRIWREAVAGQASRPHGWISQRILELELTQPAKPTSVPVQPPVSGWKSRIRQGLQPIARRVPMLAMVVRYCKRAILLPWNFHILFTELQQRMRDGSTKSS
ncbi:glycosyltransferase [Tuwongella immobilis]|uniref:Glycosyltransferase 2-like domain-containing protein n=1 Tax=Tuwongella immobilis TaxID=692036 RepID=A0A6C2YKH9_9BACT|nr:glycosyltransferase [Tuwongella immobilis]VIP01887.1 Glycosyl transferases group 1 family protein OS=Burkholderia multivorans GN=DM81_5665 PE=4 SV=1: Glycos_transf_2: Glycos_transf_1 [Tuwongella immobilis]VTR99749.1 Glycosyl transferases group 1 family protein OS=Burkholderia multivorans GN=DM81_5665 PE=4 SV=1: Glycos_transf_2: Glycos_transf_1 [Tuwongella immobilis]